MPEHCINGMQKAATRQNSVKTLPVQTYKTDIRLHKSVTA